MPKRSPGATIFTVAVTANVQAGIGSGNIPSRFLPNRATPTA